MSLFLQEGTNVGHDVGAEYKGHELFHRADVFSPKKCSDNRLVLSFAALEFIQSPLIFGKLAATFSKPL